VEATGARGLQVDLAERSKVREAVQGCDVVFHVAAKAGYWGPIDEYRRTNVDGTRYLLDAAETAGVRRFVYTSTPSVVGYDHDVENGGPDLPYPARHQSPYPETKAEAERMVLAANSRHLATVALRPHLVFGPRDNNLLPRVVERARKNQLLGVGDGKNEVDFTYVDNAAWAHLDAAAALVDHTAPCAGKVYFVSNDEPVVLWEWVNALLAKLDLPPVKRFVPLGVARALGGAMAAAWSTLPLSGEPRLTPFVANGFARSHWYDMGPAKRDLGYRVRVNMAEGTDRTVAWFRARG
jgi:nucleoside-diphosphate-sugar epimerase